MIDGAFFLAALSLYFSLSVHLSASHPISNMIVHANSTDFKQIKFIRKTYSYTVIDWREIISNILLIAAM